ncbi:Conserved oligomeric Golgi complex subunit 7 [Candida viswanathii]|uniref:Conserved oligomeric Golgi complex subunit 7 n=1 Tax=Candida viswanathii TaxID=5486 RepID=A0A367YPP5_9ASCO|nr:Conserved oligomeric Golgi complex subunit 7 [Candida viswanathii]
MASTDESLSMFFDDDFNASTYIDKLVSSITSQSSTNATTPISAYSKTSLTKLSNDISHLITHLDYYTNELTNENLQRKLDMLDKSNAIISSSEDNGTTRLQYHAHVLNNAVLSLQAELAEINKQLDDSSINNEAIQKLILLKQVKANLHQVLKIFELVSNSLALKQSYTVDEFQTALDELFNSIKKQLETSENRDKLLEHVDKLLQLHNLFNHLSKFNPIFRKFITKLSNERDSYKK